MSENSLSTVQTLQSFYHGLITLKEDRTTYIRTADVLSRYEVLSDLLGAHEEQYGAFEAEDSNQLESERLLHDCFLLISLLFLTIGKNMEPPATYAPSVVIKRLLRHLTESDSFCSKDLLPIRQILRQSKETVINNDSTYNLRVINLLDSRINKCLEAVKPLQDKLDRISPQLLDIHERLVSLRRCIKGAEARKKFSESEVTGYLDQIKQLDATRIDGKFVGDDATILEDGQDQVLLVLERSYVTAEDALTGQGAISPGLSHIAEKLAKIKYKLEKLELTQAWSLRESDLYNYIVELIAIDDQRVGRKFVAEDGSCPDEGQSIMLYLLRRSYAHVYTLMVSSEAVSEALMPIFNQLQTVRRCLQEVKKFGIQDERELYPYSMKLSSIDNMRVDGKFMVGNDIPEGQGRVASLLAECFEICQDLRTDERLDTTP
ncbi:hypothetical protein BDD12DRAFT_948934 [Trichophaea hybrida]|nr:hypothetical protein BDD12DRAFT_948934 [Trichophaea hybrida]